MQSKTLADFELPPVRFGWDALEGNTLLQQERYDTAAQAQTSHDICSQVNAGQRAVFDEITASIATAPEDAHFFVQGLGGTGKTFLYRGLSSFYQAQGKIVLCVASSGIAALLLEGG
jgi:primosomal protein N'